MSAMTEQAAEPYQLAHPAGGWTVEHIDRWPESHVRYRIPAYWRIELGPIRARRFGLAPDTDGYRELDCPVDRLVADEPFAVDVPLAELLPGWAR